MNTTAIIDHYCQAWSNPDANVRTQLLASVWAADATYTDPTVHCEGADALLAHIAKIQMSRPGARVVRVTDLDEHHGVARFGFQVIGADGAILREGIDIAFLASDRQRIDRIVGFFGALAGAQE